MLLLRTSDDLPAPESYAVWFATTGAGRPSALASDRRLPALAERVEAAFNEIRETWWRLGREMGEAPGADVAHTPTGGAFGSDFGLMLAWARLAESVARDSVACLAVCDDPWLFRHLASFAGVAAGRPPSLWTRRAFLAMRGVLARAAVSARMAVTALRLRNQKPRDVAPVILVYGHPESRADGFDAYFGNLMSALPHLRRMLHTDCPPAHARTLARDGRTASLHAWGSPLFALRLPAVRWRPERRHTHGPHGWLVRRAAARENGGGGPAMNRWQIHCQGRWLTAARPAQLAWPWENHAWERALCRQARSAGIATFGYQHTVIGPHQLNYSTATNPDGLASVPDLVIANGPAYARELAAWGVPAERLAIGGAFRFQNLAAGDHDPKGPVFVPLSAIPEAAEAQVAAARRLAERGRKVLVKEHPMYPLSFAENGNLARTDVPLRDQRGLSAVLYATGTSGLEALLAGLPTYRLMLDDRIAIDILPAQLKARAVTLETVAGALDRPEPPPVVAREEIIAPVDMSRWRQWLAAPRPSSRAA